MAADPKGGPELSMDEHIRELFEGDSLPSYLKVRFVNEEVIIELDLGMDSIEAVRRMEEICAMNYKKLDIAKLELDGPRHLRWDTFTNILVRLLLVKNIPALAVPERYVNGMKGRISGLIMNTLRSKYGTDPLKLGRVEVPLRSVIDTNIITSRITSLVHSPVDEETHRVEKLLKSYHDERTVPKTLWRLVCKVHKVAKANYRQDRKRLRAARRGLDLTKIADDQLSDLSDVTCVGNINNLSDDDDGCDGSTGLEVSVEEDLSGISHDKPTASSTKPETGSIKPDKKDIRDAGSSTKKDVYTPDDSDSPPTMRCYVCREKWKAPKFATEAVRHYPNLCPPCAEVNWFKRNHAVDLTGYVAVVTGGRIKIGYETVLKLLRNGCHVVTTTRFPHDAAQRYAAELDYNDWCDRLQIYPLELKDAKAIYQFVEHLKQKLPHIDIIVNNAAQTIRRPLSFYEHLIEHEQKQYFDLPEQQRNLLASKDRLTYQTMTADSMLAESSSLSTAGGPHSSIASIQYDVTDRKRSSEDVEDRESPVQKKPKGDSQQSQPKLDPSCPKPHICHSVSEPKVETSEPKAKAEKPKVDRPGPGNTAESWSEAVIKKQTEGSYFPVGVLDEFGQQLDLRPSNSWGSLLEEVPISELLEVMMVNTIAPYILNKELKELMMRSPHRRRFIVNISAMEGQFGRATKTRYHPHTNMAKAALNMMTRTGALGYRDDGIYMTAVDTGWVSDQRPFYKKSRDKPSKRGLALPLDCKDAAARAVDPVFMGIEGTKEPHYAVYLKNYKPFHW